MDEGTCPFKGKITFRVYNPSKPHKFGIKLYRICESSSRYCVLFDMYNSTEGCASYTEPIDIDPFATHTTKIMVRLLPRSGLLGKGHVVYLDNYYNSPELAEVLVNEDTYLCGTVRSKGRGMPKAFAQVKLKPGDSIYRRKGNTLDVKFHEKRDVYI